MPIYRLDEFTEGGLINDRRGKATRRMRQQRKGQTVKVPRSAFERSRRGNPALKRFGR